MLNNAPIARRVRRRRSQAPAFLSADPVRATGPATFEYGVAFVVLFLMTKAVIMLALTKGDPATLGLADGSLLYQALAAIAYAVCAILALARHRQVLAIVQSNKLLALLVGVALMSAFWSVSPGVTLRRGVGLVGTLAVALFIATRFTPAAFLRLLHDLLTVIALLSIIAVAVFPDVAIHDDIHSGAWRGVFAHKNNLGEAMAMGVVVSALTVSSKGARSTAALVTLFLCTGLLVMSASRASWVATVVALAAVYAVRIVNLPFWLRVPTALTLVTAGALGGTALWLNLEKLLALIGRDLTLTGRTVLWASASLAGFERPLLGHGYRAFWLGTEGGVGSLGAAASAFALQIDHGHNGFLDIWLELGMAGLVLFLAILGRFGGTAIRLARLSQSMEQRWPLVLLVLLLPVSFATTVVLDRNNYYWIIVVVTMLFASAGRFERPRDIERRRPRVPTAA